MRRATALALALGLAVLVALRSPARADGDVGVVVTGEGSMQPQLAAQISEWLSRHGHTLVPSPLPAEAITALIDCVVIADPMCARSIVEKRGTSTRVLFAQVEARAMDGGARDVTLTAYWFDRGHDAVAERKTCERCSAQALRFTTDEVLRKLLGSGDGHVKFKSNPSRARIVIDGHPIGVTPLDWDLPAGAHEIEMDKPGFVPMTRNILVVTDQVQTVALELEPPRADVNPEPSPLWSRTIPVALMLVGGAAAAAGGVMIAIDEDPVPSEGINIRNTAPAGVGLVIGGAIAGGVGAYLLWFRSDRSGAATATPVAAVTGDGAYIGWVQRF